MSFFSDIEQTNDLEETKDAVGGGSFAPLPSGVYDATIKYAYATESKGGAKGIVFGFDVAGKEHSETLWITGKNKKTYYVREGKNYPLIGFELAEAISLLGASKKLVDLKTSEKIIDVYSWEQKAKVKTAVDMFTDLLGKEVKLGLHYVKEFKKVKQGNDYVDSDETREHNVINKVFRKKDDKTVNEIRAKKDEAEFIKQWSDKWAGKVYDKTNGKASTSNQSTNTYPNTTAQVDDDVFA